MKMRKKKNLKRDILFTHTASGPTGEPMRSALLAAAVLCGVQVATHALQCTDNSGNSVDWWFSTWTSGALARIAVTCPPSAKDTAPVSTAAHRPRPPLLPIHSVQDTKWVHICIHGHEYAR